jgi:hypothetical protein
MSVGPVPTPGTKLILIVLFKDEYCSTSLSLIENPRRDLCKKDVAAFGRKPHSLIFEGLRHSAEMPLRFEDENDDEG